MVGRGRTIGKISSCAVVCARRRGCSQGQSRIVATGRGGVSIRTAACNIARIFGGRVKKKIHADGDSGLVCRFCIPRSTDRVSWQPIREGSDFHQEEEKVSSSLLAVI